MERAHPKRRFKLRFYMILLVVFGIFVVGIYYLVTHPSTGRLTTATVGADLEVNAVIIRQETTATRGDFFHIRYLVSEGDPVVDGQIIAQTFERGYDTALAEIIKAEQDIYQKQISLLQSEDGLLPQNLRNLNIDIENAISEMSLVSVGESTQDYLTLERSLRDLLRARRGLLEELVEPDAGLQNELNRLQSMWSTYYQQSTYSNTAGAGIVSFVLDGFEDALNLDQLTAPQVARVLAFTGNANTAADYLYRVVDPEFWYIAVSFPTESGSRLVPGRTYEVTSDYEQIGKFAATVLFERATAEAAMYVLEVRASVMPVLAMRTMPLTIHSGASGVAIPLNGLTYVDGVPTVYVLFNGEYYPIPVRILASNGKVAVIVAVDSSINLSAGLRFKYYSAPSETAAPATPEPTELPTPISTLLATPDPILENPNDNL